MPKRLCRSVPKYLLLVFNVQGSKGRSIDFQGLAPLCRVLFMSDTRREPFHCVLETTTKNQPLQERNIRIPAARQKGLSARYGIDLCTHVFHNRYNWQCDVLRTQHGKHCWMELGLSAMRFLQGLCSVIPPWSPRNLSLIQGYFPDSFSGQSSCFCGEAFSATLCTPHGQEALQLCR